MGRCISYGAALGTKRLRIRCLQRTVPEPVDCSGGTGRFHEYQSNHANDGTKWITELFGSDEVLSFARTRYVALVLGQRFLINGLHMSDPNADLLYAFDGHVVEDVRAALRAGADPRLPIQGKLG